MKHENIKAIAFDFWGIFAVINPPINGYLKDKGIELSPDQEKAMHDLIEAHDLDKINEAQFLESCSKLVGIEIPYKQCRYRYQEGTLNLDLINVIKKLKEKYKIALLSNNNKDYVQEYIYKPGLDKLFDVMIFSYDVGFRKPAPEMYEALIEKLGLAPEQILYVDDEPNKLSQAKALGMETLLYEGVKADNKLSLL